IPGLPTIDATSAQRASVERAARRALLLARVGRWVVVAGLVLVAFVVYLLFGTAWTQGRAQDHLATDLTSAPARHAPAAGDPVARLRIPAIGVDQVIVEGATRSDLERGPAHVHGSGLPGGHGRVVVAGHRSIAGAPFARLDELERGARIETIAPWGRAVY